MRLSIRHSVMVVLATAGAAMTLAACGGDEGENGGTAEAADAGSSSGLVSVQNIDGTDVLADSQGRALYTADVEEGGEILCTKGCESFWDPVEASSDEAESVATDLGVDLGVVERPDGSRQLALEGTPLYTFTDEGPGQLTGDGFVDDFQGTRFEWSAAAVDGDSAGSESDAESGGSLY